MNIRPNIIFSRIGAFLFMLISVLSVSFIFITYLSTTHYYEASTQLLNKDVAAHIAKYTSPFEKNGINKKKADSVFYNAMVISPSVEVYFLNTTGKVMYYEAADSLIKTRQLPLENIKDHIQSNGTDFIKGPDPKDPANDKVFSAAEVKYKSKTIGYIYVILGKAEHRTVTEFLTVSHLAGLGFEAFVIVVIFSLLLTLFYFNRLQRNFNTVIDTLGRFKQGDYNVRFNIKDHNELSSIMMAFNSLADKLAQTIERLRMSEDERKTFIANISHDLRTPLSIAKGFTETLMFNGNLNAESTEHLQLVEQKIQQVENLVKQLFELSKIESVEFKALKEPFVIAEVIREVVTSWELPAQRKNINLECIGCENNAMIFADVSMMERVIQNLLDNAIRYTPEKGNIRVELLMESNNLILHVDNTGLPIPNDVIEWVTNDGKKSSIVKRPAKSGLGLAIVKRILEIHDYPFSIQTGERNQLSFQMKIYKAS